jgi:hypothetical protein
MQIKGQYDPHDAFNFEMGIPLSCSDSGNG